jgi:hypothetical protein
MDGCGKRGGDIEGLAILCHPSNPWPPVPWFTRDYGFFSPTPLNWLEKGFVEVPAGETLRFRYRVIVHGDAPAPAQLDAEFRKWSGP